MGGAGRTIRAAPSWAGRGPLSLRTPPSRAPRFPRSPGRHAAHPAGPRALAHCVSFLCRTSEGRVACSKPGPGFGRAARVVRAGGLRVAKGRRPRGRLPLFTSLSVPRWPHPASFGVCSFSLSLDIF